MRDHPHDRHKRPAARRVGLARALSKLGFCSRSQGAELVRAGRARVNGTVRRDPEWPIQLGADRIEVEGQEVRDQAKVYLMLNKPRGLVTTAADEKGRATVPECLSGKGFPFVSPVGRLDKASEGLLLLTNDTEWAARITEPERHLDKTYHVQVDCAADDSLTRRMVEGMQDDGEFLAAKRARVLRGGGKNSWLEVVLDEGRNRQIRRLLAALDVGVLRLVRVAIGRLELGGLKKGEVRRLSEKEADALIQGKC